MSEAQAKAGRIEVRHCHGLAELERCTEIERTVWGPEDCVPLPMFVVAEETGGQVLGAFLDGTMIGFTLGLAGFRARSGGKLTPFIHSHMTAVLGEFRDRGVGRQLKLLQRKDALARGMNLVEWTFDPLEMRNAHFNLMRLGAIVRRFIPNCYGITPSPLHRGLPTDRLVAEWWLDSPRVAGLLEGRGLSRPQGDSKSILVPARMSEWLRHDLAKAAEEQARIGREFQRLFAEGCVATAIESTQDGSHYLFEPYERVKEELHADS